ncbi:unnamed protein product [Caenorhabditis angaria]|uniref:SXP/RAL-2 family protein Ani s 5-like cation-binding domain-containing protein n=1 Tax=Caenorhabditis angaria TaxID=860376 RepID=A0A9P1IW71_9PELO|nr:unnamed protein product [Caenorhabditis angaria]
MIDIKGVEGRWGGIEAVNSEMQKSCILVLVTLTAAVIARPQPPPGMPPVPPHLAAVLPKATLAELEAVHADSSLSELQKHEKIDQILVNLPDEIHDKIPLPPGFERLSAETQQQFRSLHRDRSLSFQQRHDAIRRVIDSLSPAEKALLPPPPPPPRQ